MGSSKHFIKGVNYAGIPHWTFTEHILRASPMLAWGLKRERSSAIF